MAMAKLIFCNSEIREKDCEIAPHRHGCSEMVFYENGARGETEINGRKYTFGQDDLAIIRPGVWHSEHHLETAGVLFLGFEGTEQAPEGVWPDAAHVKPLFYDIVDEVRTQEWGYERIISCKLQEILALISRKIHGAKGSVKDLTYCKRYIEENYMQDITVGELANMTGYSPDRFRHLFKEEFGISPQSYMISVRLGQAKQLLESTQISCVEIARLCGFSDGGQMTKMVKKRYGRTPRELRGSLRR